MIEGLPGCDSHMSKTFLLSLLSQPLASCQHTPSFPGSSCLWLQPSIQALRQAEAGTIGLCKPWHPNKATIMLPGLPSDFLWFLAVCILGWSLGKDLRASGAGEGSQSAPFSIC